MLYHNYQCIAMVLQRELNLTAQLLVLVRNGPITCVRRRFSIRELIIVGIRKEAILPFTLAAWMSASC